MRESQLGTALKSSVSDRFWCYQTGDYFPIHSMYLQICNGVVCLFAGITENVVLVDHTSSLDINLILPFNGL